jgi:hypothetical protein
VIEAEVIITDITGEQAFVSGHALQVRHR